jgi:GT2 family glycosyltransferase
VTRGCDNANIDVSVIVPAYNGERTIVACLESIQRAVAGRRAETIVVDSSEDTTPDLIRACFPGVRLMRSETRLSAGQARNRGIAAARGKLVFFTDQDCEVPDGWIERIERHFADPAVDGVGGAVGIRDLSSASGCALYFLEFLKHFPGRGAIERDTAFLVGCNAAYRARVLERCRFPDQTIAEDVLFGQALRRHGVRTVFDPSIAIAHTNKEGWRTFFSYNYRMGQASAGYHAAANAKWTVPFLRFPVLAFVAPLIVLPSVAASLATRSPLAYLRRFATVAPMCLLGNLRWAMGFRAGAKRLAART